MEAILTASWKTPSLVAPSPKKQTTILPVFFICCVRAAPTAIPIPPPTIPLAPRLPASRSAICMEPPFPLQVPVYLPRISAIMPFKSIPLAMACPCPRWLEVSKSSSFKANIAPTLAASSPTEKCVIPGTFPFFTNCAIFKSMRRISSILRNISNKRLLSNVAIISPFLAFIHSFLF